MQSGCDTMERRKPMAVPIGTAANAAAKPSQRPKRHTNPFQLTLLPFLHGVHDEHGERQMRS